jgi:hypothetical protein
MSNMSFKRGALVVGSAAVLFGATVGLGYAQTAPTQSQKQAVIDDAAAKLGLTGDQLREALKQARKDVGVHVGFSLGKLVHDELAVAAKTIGLADVKALRAELRGSTLTAVAQKHNVAPATVSAAIKADLNAKLTAANLSAEKTAKLKTKIDTKVDALMTKDFKAK